MRCTTCGFTGFTFRRYSPHCTSMFEGSFPRHQWFVCTYYFCLHACSPHLAHRLLMHHPVCSISPRSTTKAPTFEGPFPCRQGSFWTSASEDLRRADETQSLPPLFLAARCLRLRLLSRPMDVAVLLVLSPLDIPSQTALTRLTIGCKCKGKTIARRPRRILHLLESITYI
jgi:hypothetical protein